MTGAFGRTIGTRPRPGGPSLRLWLSGAGILAVTIVGADLLMNAGFFISSLFYAVLCGLGLVFLCVRAGDDSGRGYVIVGLCGLAIGVCAYFGGVDEVVLFGSGATNVVAANAPAGGAAFLHFRDARVLADRAVAVTVMSRSSMKENPSPAFDLLVAPIVDAGWTEGQPVGALAVIGSPQRGHRTSEWETPLNGGVKLNGFYREELATAVQKLIWREHLTVASNAVFVRWSADPEGEAAAARRRLLTACLVALALWTAAVLVNTAVLGVRRSRREVN